MSKKFNITTVESSTVYKCLNISTERADEITTEMIEAVTLCDVCRTGDQVSAMSNIAENDNEFAFIMMHLGRSLQSADTRTQGRRN